MSALDGRDAAAGMLDQQPVLLRRLDIGDLRPLLEIEQLSFPTPWSGEVYLYELQQNHLAHYWGCFVGERLAAFGGFWQIVDEAHVSNVAVHPDFRGHGLGECLMRCLMAQGLAQGLKRMTLEVRDGNIIAQNLYLKLGFRQEGRRKGYYTDNGEDALIMWADLLPPGQEGATDDV